MTSAGIPTGPSIPDWTPPATVSARLASVEVDMAVVKEAPVNIDHHGGSLATVLSTYGSDTDIFIPPGVRDINAEILVTDLDNVWIHGSHKNASRLRVTGNHNLLRFAGTCERIKISDLWLGSDAVRSGGVSAIRIDASGGSASNHFTLEDVVLQNMPAPLFIDDLEQSVLSRVRIIESINNAVTGVAAHLKNCVSMRLSDLLIHSTTGPLANDCLRLDEDCDSIFLRDCELLDAGAYGLNCQLGLGTTGPRLIRMNNVFVEGCTSSGFRIAAGRDIRASGCESSGNGAHGWMLEGGTTVRLVDCMARENQNNGYYVQGGAALVGLAILGSTAYWNGQATDNTYDGIRIDPSLVGASFIGNRCGDIELSLTNNQRYGIRVHGTGTDHLTIIGNILSGNQSGGLSNLSTGANNRVALNTGDALSAYTVTNSVTDRAYDANATTTDELADVLGTLIADLRAQGIVG